MSDFFHAGPDEARAPDCIVLPDGRKRLTRFFDIAHKSTIARRLCIDYGTLHPGSDNAPDGWECLRLVGKQTTDDLAAKGKDTRPLLQLVYEEIRSALVDKRLAPASLVSEAALSAQLGVSKTPVREALLRLQVQGLIVADGRRGARIVSPSLDLIESAHEARTILEAAAARLCASRASAHERQLIVDSARRSQDCASDNDRAGFRHWDGVFHRSLAEGAGNPYLFELIENALALTSVLRHRDVPNTGDSVRCSAHHVAIAAAVTAGDGEAAAREVASHIADVKDLVKHAYSQRAGTQTRNLSSSAAEKATHDQQAAELASHIKPAAS